MNRQIVQPGPVAPVRIDALGAAMRRMDIVLEAGRTLVDAIAQPLQAAGIAGAGVLLSGVRLEPAKYVFPAFSATPDHVAFYSETYAPEGPVVVEAANVTFGSKDGKPLVHCHGVWREQSGRLRGGHLLPFDSIVAAPARVVAVGCADVAMVSEYNAETNFSLFRPIALDGAVVAGATRPGALANIRPNEDLITSIESLCARYGIPDAIVHSCVGSLIGVEFEDGRRVVDHPTEFFVRDGRVVDGRAELEIALVDVRGDIHEGRPARGRNPVLICCELFVESSGAASAQGRATPAR